MKIEIVTGCIADSFEVDGATIYDCSMEELKDVLSNVIAHVLSKTKKEDIYKLQTVIHNLVEMFGEYESSDDACECCGDYIDTYTLDV